MHASGSGAFGIWPTQGSRVTCADCRRYAPTALFALAAVLSAAVVGLSVAWIMALDDGCGAVACAARDATLLCCSNATACVARQDLLGLGCEAWRTAPRSGCRLYRCAFGGLVSRAREPFAGVDVLQLGGAIAAIILAFAALVMTSTAAYLAARSTDE